MQVSSEMNALIGSKLNHRYRLLHIIGSGSFATVFLAVDLTCKQQVAIKCLNNKQKTAHKKEVFIMKTLAYHPNIISIIDSVLTDAYLFIVMEYCEMDLYEAITQKEGFPEDVVREVFNQVLDAVMASHSHGIYHRDIKVILSH
jgi:serine/threonine protein kinase